MRLLFRAAVLACVLALACHFLARPTGTPHDVYEQVSAGIHNVIAFAKGESS